MADFRAIYHISYREALKLPGPEFFALAQRLSAYPGVIQMRANAEEKERNRNVKPGARMVESTQRAIAADPLLADLIEFG
jgi:hypothetical protein